VKWKKTTKKKPLTINLTNNKPSKEEKDDDDDEEKEEREDRDGKDEDTGETGIKIRLKLGSGWPHTRTLDSHVRTLIELIRKKSVLSEKEKQKLMKLTEKEKAKKKQKRRKSKRME